MLNIGINIHENTGCRIETEQKYLFIAQARKHI